MWVTDDSDDASCPETITRTYVLINSEGNSTNVTQVITVDDTEDPVLHDVPGDITVECDAIPAPANVTATDNCTVALTFVEVRTDGTCPYNYTLTRTWTATDKCGNSTSASQTISVEDKVAPVLVGVPDNGFGGGPCNQLLFQFRIGIHHDSAVYFIRFQPVLGNHRTLFCKTVHMAGLFAEKRFGNKTTHLNYSVLLRQYKKQRPIAIHSIN